MRKHEGTPAKLTIEKDPAFNMDYVTSNIIDCVKYWNTNGNDIKEKNLSGEYGNARTKDQIQTMAPDDWVLSCLLEDSNTFCNSIEEAAQDYECGRTRSHVYIHKGNERVMMIHT
jgi:hypothetical protein